MKCKRPSCYSRAVVSLNILFGSCPPAPLVFLMKNNNSVLSSVSESPNILFFSVFFFLNESKAPRLRPVQLQQCKAPFVLSFGSFAPRLLPCLSAGLGAVLLSEDCRKLVDSSHRASFMSQTHRKEPFTGSSLIVRYSLVGWTQSQSSGAIPRCLPLFPHRPSVPGNGRVNRQPKSPALCSHRKLVPCLDLRSHWSDPVLPKASLSSLLGNMKNASIIAHQMVPKPIWIVSRDLLISKDFV